MSRRRQTFVVLLASAAAATFGLNRLIHRQRDKPSNDSDSDELLLKTIESQLNLTDDLLKNKDDISYISVESTNEAMKTIYHQALKYIKQIHSINAHIRERGLTRLAKLNNLPPNFYSIVGQQLDYHSAIRLARTYEANSNLFPTGPPYIFTIGNKKILATDNIEKVNDDDVLLHTLRQFLDKLIDDDKRPLDILSQHYLRLVRNYEYLKSRWYINNFSS
jgi:hypothetical protein